MNEVRGFFIFLAVILKKLVHKSGTGCARVWDGLKITKKKIRKENYKRLPRSIEPSRFQNILATESHKTLFSHASNT